VRDPPDRIESSASWSRFPLHRPELFEGLQRGEVVLTRAKIIGEREPHGSVYWRRTGWVARTPRLPDERNQIITIFLPGDFFGVKTIS
jgi:CRP/FNR family transcriptional regulator, anaerobic regulatory protein